MRRLSEGEILHIYNAMMTVGVKLEEKLEHFPKIDKSMVLLYSDQIIFMNPYASENYTKTAINYYLEPTQESSMMNLNMVKNNVKQFGIMLLSLASGMSEKNFITQDSIRQSLEQQRPYFSTKLLTIIEICCLSSNPPTFKELSDLT